MSVLEFSLSSRSEKGSVRQPREISYYSLDINSQQHLKSDAQLKYYYFPSEELRTVPNLNQGIGQWVRREEGQVKHLDELLRAVMQYEREDNKGKRAKADIVTYRGVMTRLLTLPYARDDDLDINAVWFDGQVFLELDAQQAAFKRREETERSKQGTFWGYKFEALATLPRPWGQCTREEIEARPKAVVDNVCEYCVVVRTGVGKTKVVLGAEVDCVGDYKPGSAAAQAGALTNNTEEEPVFLPLFDHTKEKVDALSHYVELKTTRTIETDAHARQFEAKLLKSWAQSFLVGIPKIVYGFRDAQGYVKAVEEFETAQVPKVVQASGYSSGAGKWDGQECVRFYDAVLAWLVKSVPKEEGKVWRLEYKAKAGALQLRELGEAEAKAVGDVVLPEFKEWRRSLA